MHRPKRVRAHPPLHRQPSVYWIGWFTVNMVIVFLSSMVTVVFGYVFQFPAFINTNFAVRVGWAQHRPSNTRPTRAVPKSRRIATATPSLFSRPSPHI